MKPIDNLIDFFAVLPENAPSVTIALTDSVHMAAKATPDEVVLMLLEGLACMEKAHPEIVGLAGLANYIADRLSVVHNVH